MFDKKKMQEELEIQKSIAYTAGILQGDITVKTLLESLAEGVIIVNEDSRIILINSRLSELSGYSKMEVMGQNINIFLPSESHNHHNDHIKSFFTSPRIRPMGIGMELNLVTKDGVKKPVEISLSFLELESGKLGLGFITDISTRKQAEDELKKRNVELDAYAHTVAHDLNSSLIGIVGFADLLLEPNLIEENEKDILLKEIAQSGRKMSTIIKELLLFASMKKEDVDISEIDMKKNVDSACKRLKFQIENTNAEIVISDEIFNCFGYAAWIEEVWFNFISNAIKYGGNPPRIFIESEKLADGYIKYSVSDNGQGVDPELQSIIFEERNAKKDKLSKGLGLGLSIVKRIIGKLGGEVGITSNNGHGSSFYFLLKER